MDVSASTPASSDQKTTTLQNHATSVPRELVNRLYAPLPEQAITPHPSKAYLSSIKTIYQIERLNEVFGLGGWTAKPEIIENDPSTGMIVLKVRLQVPAFGIDLEQFGGNDNEDRGDAYKGAFTDALGKLCGYCGIGIDVYKGDGPTKSNPKGRQRPTSGKPPATETQAHPQAPAAQATPQKYWHTVGEMRRLFEAVRERIGETMYLGELDKWNARSLDDLIKIRPVAAASETCFRCYSKMLELAKQEAA